MPKLVQPEVIQLSNGIPVILQHYDGAVAATYWWIRAGSADEAPEEAGFAHFLEHMHFKDAQAKETGRASTGQLARMVESLGGDINAYTSFDQTVYHVTCAATHWMRVIDAFGPMAKPQKFLKQDFDREREVILEELRKNEDSPGRQLFQRLFSSTFKKHPYGKPVIGFVKTLKAARVAELEAFYRRNYVSGKMGLILVGPIHDSTGKTRRELIARLEKYYGKRVIPTKEAVFRPRAVEVALRGEPSWSVLPFDVKTPTLVVSFRVPELKHADLPALDLLSGILCSGELSRIYQKLFYGTSLATEVSGGMYVPKDPGMLYFQAEVDSIDKINRVGEELFKELVRIRDEGPTPEELSRVIVNTESEKLYATQTADGMAGRIGFLKFIAEDLNFDDQYLSELKSVDAAQIQEVARKYIDIKRMSGVVLVPKENEKFSLNEVSTLAKKILGSHEIAAKSSKAPVESSLVQFMTLPSGVRVIYHPRLQSHAFSVHASVLGGTRLELTQPITNMADDWGSSHMMALSWTKGTRTKDARAISGIVEGLAAGIDGFSGRNSAGLQMTGLSRDWKKLSELFNEVLFEASFPESEVDHSRRVAQESVKGIEDHSSQLCSKLFLETLFEHHPYGRLTTGSLQSLATIDSQKLKAFHKKWLLPQNLVVSISGAVGRADLEKWLSDLNSLALGLPPAKNASSEKILDETQLKAPRWIEKSLGREQLHILVGGLGLRVSDPDRFALRILQNVLGGQSGRFFIELREKKSLAYTVSPVAFEGLERGYAGTYIASSPQKKQEALDGIRAVLEKLASTGPTTLEMKRACEFLLGRRAMDLQSDSSLAAHHGLEALYRVPNLKEEEMDKIIRSVSAKQVKEVCRKYLVEPHFVTSVVG